MAKRPLGEPELPAAKRLKPAEPESKLTSLLPVELLAKALEFAPTGLVANKTMAELSPDVVRQYRRRECLPLDRAPEPRAVKWGDADTDVMWVCDHHPALPPRPLLGEPLGSTLASNHFIALPNDQRNAHGCCLPKSLETLEDVEQLLQRVAELQHQLPPGPNEIGLSIRYTPATADEQIAWLEGRIPHDSPIRFHVRKRTP